MKKNILTTLIIISFGTFLYSSTIQPNISMRYNDVVNTKDEGIVLVINKLKKYWGGLCDENKKKIWDYMNTLITLGDLVN